MKLDNWTYDDPTEPGFYGVLICWEAEEGAFPNAARWDNGWHWAQDYHTTPPVTMRSPQSFTTATEAEAWARENDPDV